MAKKDSDQNTLAQQQAAESARLAKQQRKEAARLAKEQKAESARLAKQQAEESARLAKQQATQTQALTNLWSPPLAEPQKLDGTATAKQIKAELATEVANLAEQGVVPGLGTLLVGDDPGSKWYVNGKHKDCAEVGIRSIRIDLPETASEDDILAAVRQLNDDPACSAFIVQLPLPKGVDQNRVLAAIDPAKDADGLHPSNLGRLVLDTTGPASGASQDYPVPCTPRGIVELLERHGIDLAGKEVAVLGRGVTVGRPLGLLLTRKDVNATATLAHTGTKNLAEVLPRADVIVAAAGVPDIVDADLVKPGAILIDVGVSRAVDPDTGKSRVVGDVSAAARAKASWYSPNPGGVGPMTRAMLLKNVVEIASRGATD